jgi:hypothetical protein
MQISIRAFQMRTRAWDCNTVDERSSHCSQLSSLSSCDWLSDFVIDAVQPPPKKKHMQCSPELLLIEPFQTEGDRDGCDKVKEA